MRRTTPIERDAQRLQEVLPWHLNGTLDEADRAWVEQMLAAEAAADAAPGGGHPDTLAFDRSVAAAFEQKLAQVPADIGWARLLERARADAAPQAADRAVRQVATGSGTGGSAAGGSGAMPGSGGSWIQQLTRLFAPIMSPQFGMALAVLVAVQTVAIGVLMSDREGDEGGSTLYRSAADATQVPAIRALVDDAITGKSLREALLAHGASIVEGPNALGEYWIVTGERDPEAVAAALKEAGVIASHVIDQRQQRR